MLKKISKVIADYYDAKVEQFGASPAGVDWNSIDSQLLRFEQLTKIIQEDKCFSITDLGCGYGALLDFLSTNFTDFNYHGIDLSKKMIKLARSRFKQATFECGGRISEKADYVIASGIFNVRQEVKSEEWSAFILETLEHMNAMCHKGFAFNCLTSYSDSERTKDYLHYSEPASQPF